MLSGISPWSILIIAIFMVPSIFFIIAYFKRDKNSNLYTDTDRYSRLKFLGYLVVFTIFSFFGFLLSDVLNSTLLNYLTVIITLAAFLYITVKRLHDINMSGKWCFLSLVPLIALIMFIICLFSPPIAKKSI